MAEHETVLQEFIYPFFFVIFCKKEKLVNSGSVNIGWLNWTALGIGWKKICQSTSSTNWHFYSTCLTFYETTSKSSAFLPMLQKKCVVRHHGHRRRVFVSDWYVNDIKRKSQVLQVFILVDVCGFFLFFFTWNISRWRSLKALWKRMLFLSLCFEKQYKRP